MVEVYLVLQLKQTIISLTSKNGKIITKEKILTLFLMILDKFNFLLQKLTIHAQFKVVEKQFPKDTTASTSIFMDLIIFKRLRVLWFQPNVLFAHLDQVVIQLIPVQIFTIIGEFDMDNNMMKRKDGTAQTRTKWQNILHFHRRFRIVENVISTNNKY
jgi:hypothetical protein